MWSKCVKVGGLWPLWRSSASLHLPQALLCCQGGGCQCEKPLFGCFLPAGSNNRAHLGHMCPPVCPAVSSKAWHIASHCKLEVALPGALCCPYVLCWCGLCAHVCYELCRCAGPLLCGNMSCVQSRLQAFFGLLGWSAAVMASTMNSAMEYAVSLKQCFLGRPLPPCLISHAPARPADVLPCVLEPQHPANSFFCTASKIAAAASQSHFV